MTEPSHPADLRPLSEAMTYRQQYAGLIGVASKVRIADASVLSTVYTPGVAQPCLDIEKHPSESFAQTMRGNTVAIVSDGSAAFGLGMVGPEAILPVMEGKSVVFKTFAGDLRQFHRPVAADRDEVRALDREDGIEDPIAMAALEEDLLAGLGLDGAERVVGAAEGDQLRVGGPTAAVDGVEGDRD